MESPNKFALHSAISSNNLPLITSIIQSDPTSVNLIDDKDNPPLSYALQNQDKHLVDLLLDNGANGCYFIESTVAGTIGCSIIFEACCYTREENDCSCLVRLLNCKPSVVIVQNALDNVNHRQFITTGAAEGQKRCLKSKKLLERYLAQTPYGCNACGAGPQVLSLCNGCKVRGYCNRECQLKDWKTHKKVCGKEEIVWNVLTAEETVVGSGKKKGKGKKGKKK